MQNALGSFESISFSALRGRTAYVHLEIYSIGNPGSTIYWQGDLGHFIFWGPNLLRYKVQMT